jgi:DNA-binding response OmpR family regulator
MTMKILLVDDDAVSRRVLEEAVRRMGHDLTVVSDGTEAWAALEAEGFDCLISDWVMPGLDGLELCRRVRAREGSPFLYIMLVSHRNGTDHIAEGIMAGANDFMPKPCAPAELRARLHAAERMVALERSLARQLEELRDALDEVATLRRLLPICMYCKSIRNDQEVWNEIEEYFRAHAHTEFTHSICPTCYTTRIRPMLDELKREREAG